MLTSRLPSAFQLLDLPGIIEGAKDGKGRGRQVIAGRESEICYTHACAHVVPLSPRSRSAHCSWRAFQWLVPATWSWSSWTFWSLSDTRSWSSTSWRASASASTRNLPTSASRRRTKEASTSPLLYATLSRTHSLWPIGLLRLRSIVLKTSQQNGGA